MIPIIEDAVLGTDLDAQFHSLLNVKSFDPVPPNLVTSDDLRLNDVREPLPGSVVNASVAADAAIDQSKINFNGMIPGTWLGSTFGTAAPGDLAEYISNKNVPGGYAGLDSTGKIPVATLPDSVGLATVTSVGITLPPQMVLLPGSTNPITGSGTFKIGWLPMSDAAWFGALAAGAPDYQYGPIPVALVPNLNTAQVTSGIFDTDRLPLAHGVGGTHAPGMVKDPGTTGLATDYFGRDCNWHAAPVVAAGYQPVIPALTLTKAADGTDFKVTATTTVADVTYFYSFTDPAVTPAFHEFTNGNYIIVAPGNPNVWVYASRVGWSNSAVAHITLP